MLQHFESGAEKAVFLSLCVLFTVAAGLSLASVADQVGRPAPGFVVWSNLVVPAIGTAAWPGQRAGIPLRSVLVAANGQPLADAAALRTFVRQLPVGTPVTYTFHHGTASVEATVPTTILGWRHIVPAYAGYVIAGVAFLATALIVFYFRPALPAARATLALGTILGLTLLLALDLFSGFWVERLYFCFESLMPAALLHVALCFPEEKDIVRRHPQLRWLVYVPFALLAIAQNYLLDRDAAAHLRVNDWVYTATAGAGLLTFASLVHSFRSARTPRTRQQAKAVLAAAAGAAFVPSLALLSITLLGLQMPMNVLSPFFILYPLSMAYAIARHDLFAVDRYLRLGVVYAALSVTIVVSYAVVVMAAESSMGGEHQLPRGLIPLYLFIVVVLFDPLRSRVQSVVDRLFNRQAYSYRGTVEATSRTLASALDTELIANTLLSTLTEVMAIEWAVLLVWDGAGGGAHAFGRPRERADACLKILPPGDAHLRGLTRRLGPLIREEAHGSERSQRSTIDLTPFHRLGADLVLPLRFREQPVGVLLVGPNRSGAYYTDETLDLIDTLLNQTALALTNARAYEVIRHTQADLVRAERMAAVGELAAAVAHGIRNPLSGIRGTAQVAREDTEGETRLARDLDNILSEADRLERRVRSILELARPIDLQLVPADLGPFLADVAAGLRTRLPSGVRLSLDVHADLPAVTFDSARLNEVIETIVVNAIEAMGAEGAVTIAARRDNGDGYPSAVVVSIADTGSGIPSAVLGRVFDLFYTTKAAGTGMGLAMAKLLVERQGGAIEARNAPSGGAVFSIRLAIAPRLTDHRA